jgi:type II secretory ATPase GspE/PulE/Tfp pilus assembly ATPase PilB-like protein
MSANSELGTRSAELQSQPSAPHLGHRVPSSEGWPGDLPEGLHLLPPEDAVHRLLDLAVERGISDLFFLAGEDDVHVAARHLGILRPLTRFPVELGRHCMAHIKAAAGMDVAEHRRPLDGRWLTRHHGRHVDLRISTIPTLYGEDFTLRLLVRESMLLNLDALGLFRKEYNELLKLLLSPSGLLLVTGPTGAGKTTTLYACLNQLNNGRRKINTIEDPVEYALGGVRQSQVNPRLKLDFPDLLRGVLRQAPDVIMVGEIRDPVTAETAVRAANSGHLVLATLHAPGAAGAVQSLLSLEVHPHFVASSLRGVVAQRLVRTLCPDCKVAIDLLLSPHTFDEVRPWLEPGEGQTLYAARGCPRCGQTGYAARTGVFEVLTISEDLRKLIQAREPTQVLRRKAVDEGMIEMRQAALLAVARGQTTSEEVLRVVPPEYLGLEGAST